MKTPPLIKRLLLLFSALVAFAHAAPNLIVTTDIGGDPDDTQAMTRLMLYANEFNLMGLIASSSGVPGQLADPTPRTDIIDTVIDRYDSVRSNLLLHASGYPTAGYLHSLVKAGNINRGTDYVGAGNDTAASSFIVSQVDAAAGTVAICIWGGATDVAQAFYQMSHDTARTQAQKDAWVAKVRIYAIADQDGAGTTVAWIKTNFPTVWLVETGDLGFGAMGRGMYQNDATQPGTTTMQLVPTAVVPLNQAAWLGTNVINNHGALGAGYPITIQNIQTSRNTTGVKEGDTPSWFYFLPNGLSDAAHPTWGGWGGRMTYVSGGATTSFYNDVNSYDTHWNSGANSQTKRKWCVARWREAYQNEFGARMDWCVKSYADANHAPAAVLNGDTTRNVIEVTAEPGSAVGFSAAGSSDPDGDTLTYKWWQYREAGTYGSTVAIANATSAATGFTMPSDSAGQSIHIILEVTDNGAGHALTSYRRLVVTGGASDGPVARWTLDETSGTTAADSSGNHLDGTLVNGPAWVSGGALDFDGANDYVDIGDPAQLRLTGAMTLSAWVKIDSFANSGRIVSKQGYSGARGWSLNVESTGVASFQIAPDSTSLVLVNSPALDTGRWYLLTGVYEPGAALKLYVDGELAAGNLSGIPAAQFSANGLDVNLGRRPDGGLYYDGQVDDVRIYNRALSGSEVAALAAPSGPAELVLTVADTANVADWSVQFDLRVGDVQYGDRAYVFTAVPSPLLGADWIRTANDSKAYTGATLVGFDVSEDTDVYVAHNDAITTKPSWLADWTDTGLDLVNNESTPKTFSLFRKAFAAGATVELGNNGSTAAGNYTVLLQPSAADPFVVGAETILDNTAGSGVTATFGWTTSSATSGYYGANYLHDGNANKGGESVTFTPGLTGAGPREVYVRWTAYSNRASNARFTVNHAGGSETILRDERYNGGQWILLGTWSFDAGTGGNVVVDNTGTDGYVIADAVRFVNVATP